MYRLTMSNPERVLSVTSELLIKSGFLSPVIVSVYQGFVHTYICSAQVQGLNLVPGHCMIL